METIGIVVGIGAGSVAIIGAVVGTARWAYQRIRQPDAPPDQNVDYKELAGELLRQFAEGASQGKGAPTLDTEELAQAAGPDTEARLREALEFQSQHKERKAIDCLYEAFRRDLEPLARAQLHLLLGNSYVNISELEEAEGHLRQALNASRQASNRRAEADTLGNLGVVFGQRGDFVRALESLHAALEIDRELHDRVGEGATLANLGNISLLKDDLDEAAQHFKDAIVISRETDERNGEANAVGNLGLVYRRRGDLDAAEECFRQSLRICEETGNRLGQASELGNLGNVFLDKRDYARASQHFNASLRIHQKIENRVGEANALGSLGLIAIQRGDKSKACRLLYEALRTFEEVGATLEIQKTHSNLQKIGCEERA